jgi:hypothetical protein
LALNAVKVKKVNEIFTFGDVLFGKQFKILTHRFKSLKSIAAIVAVMKTSAQSWSKWRFHGCISAATKWTWGIAQYV